MRLMFTESAEAQEFGQSVAGTLRSRWPDGTSAAQGDLADVAKVGAEQGWYSLGSVRAFDALAEAMWVLGRHACPLPIHDAYVASTLLDEAWSQRIDSGDVRPVVSFTTRASEEFVRLEGVQAATHVLSADTNSGEVRLFEIESSVEVPGLAVPAWSDVDSVREVARVALPANEVKSAATLWAFVVALRALGAADRAHGLACEHAKLRRQFGRTIGGFGAVQQRVAAAEIDVTAAQALAAEALRGWLRDADDAMLALGLAIRFMRDVAPRVNFDAQHTLGAIGYFEEHEAAWLFRRVHADALQLREAPVTPIDQMLIEEACELPAFALGEAAEALRTEVRQLLERHRLDDASVNVEALREEAAQSGLFAMGWPAEHSGRPASTEQMAVLTEEMKRAGGPVDRAMSASVMLGHSILQHGTPEQQREFLPLIRQGQLAFCLGYSEPEAGSDLASLRTLAVRDGEDWVIDGQKLWTTRAQSATHVWLAVRTDPEATPRHAGITIFMIPMDTPGISLAEHVALSGEISCTVFYDSVRVPDTMRVGEINGGWKVITGALSSERLIMGAVAGSLLRQFDTLVDCMRDETALRRPDAVERDRLAGLAARLQAARCLVLAGMLAEEDDARKLAPMAAVLSGEFAEEFGQASIELLGSAAALATDVPGALGDGVFEAALRLAPMYVIGGGTNDIQRGLIARALGLAREG